jgi:hypothetical protein|tara:strand:- start:723 stop:899 length:177 start_codon:yes stop_codon:yes gene_type:complete
MTNIEQVNFELSQDNIDVEVSIFGNTAEIRDANGDMIFALDAEDLSSEEVIRNLGDNK